jgi:erythromycin esterase-like protein
MYFWTWNTQEVLAMIEWMRQFNASGKGRIQFTGFDMQTPTVAMEIVRELLQKADPEYEKSVRAVYQQATLLREAQSSTGFGVATGSFPVKTAAGTKITFSGAIRTAGLTGGFAGLWWRADGPKGVLAFDNMQGRGPSGTTDWKRYEISLDVPADTVTINFGLIMPGRGTAWFDDLQLEIDGAADNPAELFDFDFESGQTKGFFIPSTPYTVQIDSTIASRGRNSLRMQSQAAAGAPAEVVNPADASRQCGEVVARMESSRGDYLERADRQAVEWAIQSARVVHQYAQNVASQVSRDESMARNVKWILDTAPKGTRVVLWAHNGHVGRISRGLFRAMGSYLDEWYGKEHVVVGFAINRGEYTAVTRGAGLGRNPLQAAAQGSYEYAFARPAIPRFILDLRLARADDPASAWLRGPMQFRSIGAMAMEQQTTATRGLWDAPQKN